MRNTASPSAQFCVKYRAEKMQIFLVVLTFYCLLFIHQALSQGDTVDKDTEDQSEIGLIELGPDNYDQQVLSSHQPILVAFDDPIDYPNARSAAVLEEIGRKLDNYGIRTGYVDCSNAVDNKKICMGANLRSLPAFQLFLEVGAFFNSSNFAFELYPPFLSLFHLK